MQRLDPSFHSVPNYGALLRRHCDDTHTIAEFAEIIDSGRAITGRRDVLGIVAYEVGHIGDGYLKPTNVRVSSECDRILTRHDILTGRVGSLGCFAEYKSSVPASFSANTLRIRPKTKYKHRAGFVTAFLNSEIGKGQLVRDSQDGLQKVVTQKSIGGIIVPLLGEGERRLVAELDAARAERDNALAEAERLLDSIDEMVKEKLKLPEVALLEQLGYAIRLSTIKHNKTLSADYFHPERMVALRAIQKVPNAPLSQLVKFKRKTIKVPEGMRYIGLASIASNTGLLSDTEETATGQCVVFGRSDVLYGRLRPYLNKVWLADFDGVCSTEFHVMQPSDQEALRSEYLAVVMRTSLIVAQTKHMMTGNTHPRIANDDVKNLLIPLADYTVQKIIVEETLSRQAEALRLRAHAETVWREAREHFEQQLLQGGNR